MQYWGGLRYRLVLLVLIALLPMCGLFAYFAAKDQEAALAQARDKLQAQVLLVALNQRLLVERVAQLLGDMANGPSIKDPGIRLCVDYLKNLQVQNARYTNLGVLDLNGRISCQALDSSARVDYSSRTFFQQVLATQKFAIGEMVVGSITRRNVIGFGAPVYGGDGLLNGVAFATLDVAAMASALSATELADGSQLRLLDARGTILAAHGMPAPQLLGSSERDERVLAAIKDRRSGIQEMVDAEGTERIYAYAPVGGTPDGGMWVAMSVPRHVVTAEPREAFLITLAALLAMTAFGAGCAWWLGGKLIVQPAHAILKQASEVASGDLSARVQMGPQYLGELGEIGASFNRMAEALQARGSEIDNALLRVNKQRALLDLIVNSLGEGVIVVDQTGHFVLFNNTVEKFFHVPQLGTTFDDWRQHHEILTPDGKSVYPKDERPLKKAMQGITTENWDTLARRPGRTDLILRVSARPLRDAAGELIGAVTVFNDITDLKAAESFVREQQEVLALIARGVPLHQSLEAIVQLIESRDPGSLCSILLVREGHLRHGATVSLPQHFIEQIEGLVVGEGGGCCGAAAHRKQPVYVSDLASHPLTQPIQAIAAACRLGSCWSTPLLSADGEVLATFALYHREPGSPEPRHLELMDIASRLALIALERHRAEQALVSSERRFREMAENIQDVFYNVDVTTGAMLYISPGYEKVWGRSCDSLYAQPNSYLNAVLPDDKAIVLRADALVRAKQAAEVEYRIVSSDGQTRWIRDNSYPVLNNNGELKRIVGTARDVTDHKMADVELAGTNRALQMLSRTAIAIQKAEDEASLLTEVCAVAVDIGKYRMAWVGYALQDEARTIKPMAYAGEELGYLSSAKLSWSEHSIGGQGPAARAIRSAMPIQYGDIPNADSSFTLKVAALARGYHSAICLPMRGEHEVFGVITLFDSTAQHFSVGEMNLMQELADNLAFGIGSLRARAERKRSEVAAQAAAAIVREQASLLDRAQDVIIVRNLDGTIRYWNKSAERLYGWTAEEVLGKTMDQQMYRSPEILAKAMREIMATDADWTGELEQIARDGSVVIVEARSTVLRDPQGRPSGVMSVDTDIRKRKLVEQEILHLNASLEERVQRRTEQLEFANKQLEAFSYSVSHDLRTPLSSVDGFSNLLEKNITKGLQTESAEQSLHYLSRIRAGVSQMGELIDAMLSLAQVSRSDLKWEPANLSAMAEALLKSYQEREPRRAVRLHVEPGLVTQGDPRLLNQVLDNLLGNAWKFSNREKCTDIRFGRERQDSDEMVYFVRDRGAGFDMAYAEKLFGAFQRLHSPAEFAGTGIGLTTVQRIVSRHGGRVWANSAPRQGATFYFTLGSSEQL